MPTMSARPVQSSGSIARDQKDSHVPKPGKTSKVKADPDQLGTDPKTDRTNDNKDISDYYGHVSARHPRSQAAKLFPSRDYH